MNFLTNYDFTGEHTESGGEELTNGDVVGETEHVPVDEFTLYTLDRSHDVYVMAGRRHGGVNYDVNLLTLRFKGDDFETGDSFAHYYETHYKLGLSVTDNGHVFAKSLIAKYQRV